MSVPFPFPARPAQAAISPQASGFVPAGSGAAFDPPAPRRDRLWELSPNLHCSIIGTCLSGADLRSLMAKLGLANAGGSEHDLHAQAVSRASLRDEGGKLLHKLLDRRHEREVRRFAKAKDVDGVRSLWRTSLENGDIAGAYWAVLTHPLTDRELVKEAFGEVHMLSHLLGRSVRADLRRLAEIEAEAKVRLDTIGALEARVAELTRSRVAADRRGEDLERDLRGALAATRVPAADGSEAGTLARLEQQLDQARAKAAAEEQRRIEAERATHGLAEQVRDGAAREAVLRREIECLEAALDRAEEEVGGAAGEDLRGMTLLYVGGRPRQVAQARLQLQARGAELLTHDGGIAEATTLLPGLVSRADAVVFPVDCISHDAAGTIKRACRDLGRQFVPLRSAGLASLLVALPGLRQPAA